ncbi:MAG: hypothetical protein IJ113_04350 [Eggerthellaceae bacterium]|nr:hypothetical protein [Eggerthellaceae bacterium]
MHDLSLNLFYKTTFDVHEVDGCEDLLWETVCNIREWICRKYEEKGQSISRNPREWTAFKRGQRSDLGTSDGSVRLESAAFWTGESSGDWACSITEVSRERGLAPREWKTEIGFHEDSMTEGTLSVVLTYGDRAGYLGKTQESPKETIPNIIWRLINHPKIECTTSGMPACAAPTELHPGEFEEFWKFVSDSKRATPIIYISPRMTQDGKEELLVDPEDVVEMLGPSALVYYSCGREFTNELLDGIGNLDYRCSNGQVRVYDDTPHFEREGEARRHRFFLPKDIEEMGAGALLRIFRRSFAQNVDFYEQMVRVDDIRATLRRKRYVEGASEQLAQNLADLKLQMEQTKEDAKESVAHVENNALEMLGQMEEELAEMRSDLELFANDNERLDNENKELRAEKIVSGMLV